MRRLRNLLAGVAAATTLFAGAAYAEPTLQLDILDGVYDTNTETIVATSDQFTLYALLLPDQDTLLGDTFYISAALVPQTSTSTDLGSFTFNGTTIDVTADMVYGVPPLEANLAFDANDLSKHGIFPTYFAEFEFTFDPNNTATAYNTQDDAGEGPTQMARCISRTSSLTSRTWTGITLYTSTCTPRMGSRAISTGMSSHRSPTTPSQAQGRYRSLRHCSCLGPLPPLS